VYFDDLEILHTSSNATLQADDFYPFGLPMDNNGFLEVGVKANRFMYQGKEWQTELGLNLYDFHARQFDPSLGRFISADAASQFSSPYLRMGNMPTMGVDPDGNTAFLALGAVL
jgi:RHS repeat-associated protein